MNNKAVLNSVSVWLPSRQFQWKKAAFSVISPEHLKSNLKEKYYLESQQRSLITMFVLIKNWATEGLFAQKKHWLFVILLAMMQKMALDSLK